MSRRTALSHADARLGAQAFGWIRVAIGAVLFTVPSLFARGFRTAASPSLTTAVRAAAIRDLALGVGALQAREDAELARWVEAGIVADAGDVAALARARGMRPLIRAGAITTASSATVLGTLMRRALR
jgi:hypothetical protein